MGQIKIINVNNFILKNVNLTINKKEIVVILGQTGSGKSTLLNVIAGLINFDGEVLLNNKPINNITLQDCKIGYMFQDLCLFPHYTVYENIAFSLKCKKINSEIIKEQVYEIIKMMKLEHLINRFPKYLSGGEKQKVALARVFISKPELLLLDEPLSSIDAVFKDTLLSEIMDYLQKLKITTIYVTHNIEEAFILADKIAIIHNGKIQQYGEKNYVIKHIANTNVVNYFGLKNYFKGKIISLDKEQNTIKIKFNNFIIESDYREGFRINDIINFCIWPQDIKILYEEKPLRSFVKHNHFKGKIIKEKFHGLFYTLYIYIDNNTNFELKIPAYIYRRLNLYNNKIIKISLIKSAIQIF